ncbi:MAG: GNAT family N-acetyltransferase [Candidatus Rokuibacteriota bacterium]|nr:MAG: GNAT family N-acetyltransferase [Candidatus Rokubacteria bacterium]
MNPPATLETPRLRLRLPVADDAAAIFDAYTQDIEVARYTSWSPHRSMDETRKFLDQHCEAGWKAGTVFSWLITLAEGGHAAGMIDFRLAACRAEVGYVLARRYWGHGLMTEAARVVVDWVISQPEIHRAWATVDLENPASQRVLEKVGMVREGVLRHWMVFPNLGFVPRDVWSFARIKETGTRQ